MGARFGAFQAERTPRNGKIEVRYAGFGFDYNLFRTRFDAVSFTIRTVNLKQVTIRIVRGLHGQPCILILKVNSERFYEALQETASVS